MKQKSKESLIKNGGKRRIRNLIVSSGKIDK
jgi:hypothetical protein